MSSKPEQKSLATLSDFGAERLSRLCRAMELEQEMPAAIDLFRRMSASWGRKLVGETPVWPSEVGDDHSPFEFSIAISSVPELRMMVEPMAVHPSFSGNAQAAEHLIRELARDFEIDVNRFEKVRDLFLPANGQGVFAAWVAADIRRGHGPQFKLYLNPAICGDAMAPSIVEEAMSRLGIAQSWSTISRFLLRRGSDDELKYFSIDVSSFGQGRVKIYARHRHCTVADLEAAASGCPSYRSGDVQQFLRAVAPQTDRAYDGRAPFTCYAFTQSDPAHPVTVTTHFPINGYALNDLVVRDRVLGWLESMQLPAARYGRVLAEFPNRPLDSGVGQQSYVSFRREKGQPRLTVYLPVEAYRPGVVARTPVRVAPKSALEVVQHFEKDEPITSHPFMRRLRREPVDLRHLWKILANFQISISKNFARRLADITARTDDERIRCILADQLHDEMGRGDFSRAHINLFSSMMERLKPWAPPVIDESILEPGRLLDPKLAAIYGAPDVFEGIGAVMAGEVFGKQMDQFLGEEFRRQNAIDAASLEWLMLHEELEVEHADSSAVLAGFIASEDIDTVWRGARKIADAGREFFDDLYVLCYAK